MPPPTAVSVRTLLRFTRVEHTIFSLPLLFAGAWLGAGRTFPAWHLVGLIVLAGLGARIFGMTMNRILDRHLDARNPRTAGRELPAGRLTLRQTTWIALVGLGIYLLACFGLGPACTWLAPIPVALLFGYSLLKRFTCLCHFGIGLCLALAPLGAWVAASQAPLAELAIDRAGMLLAAFAFCWISGFDIIYALQDVEADRASDVRSLPARLGWVGAQAVAAGVHGLGLGCLAWLIVELASGAAAWTAFALTLIAVALAYLPQIPLEKRFFPLSALAGIAGASAPLIGGLV